MCHPSFFMNSAVLSSAKKVIFCFVWVLISKIILTLMMIELIETDQLLQQQQKSFFFAHPPLLPVSMGNELTYGHKQASTHRWRGGGDENWAPASIAATQLDLITRAPGTALSKQRAK